jgi:hypothetical protein
VYFKCSIIVNLIWNWIYFQALPIQEWSTDVFPTLLYWLQSEIFWYILHHTHVTSLELFQ